MVNEEGCVLEMCWVSIKNVLMELAAVVVDDYLWWCLKTGQENFKWVLWRLVQSHHFKSTADSMGAIDGENARRWLDEYL